MSHQHSIECVPACREIETVSLYNVPKHFDGGDVETDDNGPTRWYGAEMSCLECRETAPVRMGMTRTYRLATLECGECSEVFAEFWS